MTRLADRRAVASRRHRRICVVSSALATVVFAGASCGRDSSSSASSIERQPTSNFPTSTAPISTIAASTTGPSTTAPSTTAATSMPTDVDTTFGKVSLVCSGHGSIPVVLMAGGNDPPSGWDELVDTLGDSVLACRFDPTAMTTGTTASRRAEALSDALLSSALTGPVVLVGHSLGGLTVRQSGVPHPEQLAGAVMLDATTPLALLSLETDLANLGWDVPATQADANAEAPWPAVPLRVLAHDPALLTLGSDTIEELWTAGQQHYAAMSPLGEYESVAGSGHYVYVDVVERVAAAINEVLALA